jgi:hypothetical protein
MYCSRNEPITVHYGCFRNLISNCYLISINLPPVPETVIPEAILIGNPASNLLKSWIPDTSTRG